MSPWLDRLLHRPSPDRLTDPRVLFVHIPKTAGISLYTALQQWAGPARSVRYAFGGGDTAAWEALPDAEIAQLRLIAGHLYYPAFMKRGLDGWSAVTVLRDPFARTLSVYPFVRANPEHPWFETAMRLPLEDFLDWMARQPANLDQQCRFIAGDPDPDAAYETLRDRFLLATALDGLPAFTRRLSELLGTRLRVPRLNQSPRLDPALMSDATRERLLAMNERDLVLYRRVLEDGLLGSGAPDVPVSG